ncbi:MAG: Asp-tRNA(Asn)/Glu-tRNA(Gln) amidotransferase subunit GatB, partial [Patescibacteria group bacterium]
KGEMRCEANISLRKKGASEFGTKVEVKNLNSFKAVERAIEYEIARQAKLLDEEKKVIQETRGWDENGQKTFSQRTKESAHDYRYFPEPDLPPLKGDFVDLKKIRAEIGELPNQKRVRFQKEYGLAEKDVEILVFNPDSADYYERVVSELSEWLASEKMKGKETEARQLAANYLLTDLQKLLKETAGAASELLISPENFAEMITLIIEGKISSAGAKIVLEEMFRTGADPSIIIEEKNLGQVSGDEELRKFAIEAINANQKAAADYKAGQNNALQFLVGQVMVRTKGRANPQIISEILRKLLTNN